MPLSLVCNGSRSYTLTLALKLTLLAAVLPELVELLLVLSLLLLVRELKLLRLRGGLLETKHMLMKVKRYCGCKGGKYQTNSS